MYAFALGFLSFDYSMSFQIPGKVILLYFISMFPMFITTIENMIEVRIKLMNINTQVTNPILIDQYLQPKLSSAVKIMR